jgi:peptide chain release factor 2
MKCAVDEARLQRTASRRYNARFSRFRRSLAMEAERQNAIAEKLADLAARGRELRRYL